MTVHPHGELIPEPVRIATQRWVYGHLVCEFAHYDVCLRGLVECDGVRSVCVAVDVDGWYVASYVLHEVNWTDECQEYLDDYRVAYKHWCYENGRRQWTYNGWDLSWFGEKWKGRNPIIEAAGLEKVTA